MKVLASIRSCCLPNVVDSLMSSTQENPYRPPDTDGGVRFGDRALWIEYRLRDVYVAICAATAGAFVYGRLPHHVIYRLRFPADIMVLFCCTILPAAGAVVALHIWRSKRSPETSFPIPARDGVVANDSDQ